MCCKEPREGPKLDRMDSLPGQSQVLRFSTLGRIFWGGNWGHISDFSPKIIPYLVSAMLNKGFPGGTSGKGPLASTGDIRDSGLIHG